MRVARRLLEQTQLSTAEVAGRVGYGSEPAFSRAFRAWVGQPPGAYRCSVRSSHSSHSVRRSSADSRVNGR